MYNNTEIIRIFMALNLLALPNSVILPPKNSNILYFTSVSLVLRAKHRADAY
jgi:hypothetical protein